MVKPNKMTSTAFCPESHLQNKIWTRVISLFNWKWTQRWNQVCSAWFLCACGFQGNLALIFLNVRIVTGTPQILASNNLKMFMASKKGGRALDKKTKVSFKIKYHFLKIHSELHLKGYTESTKVNLKLNWVEEKFVPFV